MKELKAEAIFFRRSFDQFARGKNDGADPLAAFGFGASVEQQKAWFEYAP